MKYILMMAGTKVGVDTYKQWSESDVQAHFAFLKSLNKELREAGEFVANVPLVAPDQAKVVRAGTNGAPITDDVFPEGKEFLLGYWIVDVKSAERAYEIAARLSAGPGPGGVPMNMPIEASDHEREDGRTAVTDQLHELDARSEHLLRDLAPHVLGATGDMRVVVRHMRVRPASRIPHPKRMARYPA